jgi:hypothetical protein
MAADDLESLHETLFWLSRLDLPRLPSRVLATRTVSGSRGRWRVADRQCRPRRLLWFFG